jgi:hypothetical protein
MRTAVAFLVAVLGMAASASAQISTCPAVTDTSSRTKILLDDIVGVSSSQNLLQALTSRLDANLEQIQAELGVDLKIFPCEKRRPSGPSDFNREAVQQLSFRGVLMEVWGTTAEVKDEKGQPLNEASVGYMIVPVRLDEFQSQRAPGAFIIAERARPSQVVDDMLRLVDQGGRLPAYATLAVGSRSLRSSQWNEARRQLCAAATQFARLKSSRPDDAALARYAEQLAADVVARARNDPAYSGFLKEGVTPPCS